MPQSIGMTVLIVEDDLATGQLYRRVLQPEYHVLVTANEDDVLALMTVQPVHLLIMEPGPVGGRGWAVLAELQRRPELQRTPVILCTAQDERRLGYRLGAVAYLVKPVLPGALLETVRRLTGSTFVEGAA